MKYLSVCSGIEAATVAWHPLGWEPVAFCEIDPFPAAVLAHHFHEVPNHGDFTQLLDPDHPVRRQHVDLLVGGTPCQSFSVAGLRGGLEDPRGNLALAFVQLVGALEPRWVVWENVPGALSADGGRAFGSILGALEDLGYGWAYRVLDAQYVRVDGHPRAVPQRRRRVFLVGHSGGQFQRAAAVLFEPEGVFGDSPPRREAGQGAARGAARGAGEGGAEPYTVDWMAGASGDTSFRGKSRAWICDKPGKTRSLTANRTLAVAFHATQDPISSSTRSPCISGGNKAGCASVAVAVSGDVAHTLRGEGFDASEDGTGRGTPVVAFSSKDYGADATEECSPTMRAAGHHGSHMNSGAPPAVAHAMKVRRLTERECERLMGYPDDYTAIPWNGKPAAECPSGHRYKALGNSMAVNVMRWIGMRIALVDSL